MFVEDVLSPEDREAARRAWKDLREKKAAEKAAKTASIHIDKLVEVEHRQAQADEGLNASIGFRQ